MTGTTPPSRTPGTSGRRGLPPAIIAFIVLDVLLVIAAIALGIAMSSDGSPASEETSASSSATSSTTPGAEPSDKATPAPSPSASLSADAKQVASPSGNITCTLTPEGAECAIATLAAEPVAADGCEGVTGYVVSLSTSGVSTPCVSDKPAKAAAEVPVLAYGDTVAVNNFECESTEAGMTCSNTNTGQGFTLARAGVTRL